MSANTKDIESADILDRQRREIAANRAANTAQKSFTPKYAFPVNDVVNVQDAIGIDADVEDVLDTVNVSDAETDTLYVSGDFRITDEDGNTPAGNPARIDFSDIAELDDGADLE